MSTCPAGRARAVTTSACLLIGAIAPIGAQAPARSDSSQDAAALIALEQRWLISRDSAELDRILADDFRHPVPQGVVLTKAEQIHWAVTHPATPGVERSLHDMKVRVYQHTAIVNGAVCAIAADGTRTRSLFTDVFVWRDGRWQAVNAQENISATTDGC